ncbi:MAG: cell wall hydrolase [Bacillota bacterium]
MYRAGRACAGLLILVAVVAVIWHVHPHGRPVAVRTWRVAAGTGTGVGTSANIGTATGTAATVAAAPASWDLARPGQAYDYNFDLMARVISAEAKGEPYVGQVAVGAVILNRVEHPHFPKTIPGVIFEPDAFTAVSQGTIWLPPTASSVRAAQDALAGWDPTGGALYYYNPAKATNWWITTRHFLVQIGRHVFFR